MAHQVLMAGPSVVCLSDHVRDDHRYAVQAARAAGVPDALIMLAHSLGEGLVPCDGRTVRQGGGATTPSDNIFTVERYAGSGWDVADLTRVLDAYRRAGNRALIAGEVFADLDQAIRRGPKTPQIYPFTALDWLNNHDWVGEYVKYVDAGRYNFADHMVRSRIAYRYGHRVIGSVMAAPSRWLDLVDIALLGEDGTEPEIALDHLLPYLFDPRVRSASVVTLYSWIRKVGVEQAVLCGLAGLTREEGLAFRGEVDVLRSLAALRA